MAEKLLSNSFPPGVARCMCMRDNFRCLFSGVEKDPRVVQCQPALLGFLQVFIRSPRWRPTHLSKTCVRDLVGVIRSFWIFAPRVALRPASTLASCNP